MFCPVRYLIVVYSGYCLAVCRELVALLSFG